MFLWKNYIDFQNYNRFETFQTFITENEEQVAVAVGIITEISEHLNNLKGSFGLYLHEEIKNVKEKKWIMNPFQPGIKTGTATKAEEQHFDLYEDALSKMDFNNKKLIQF